MGTTAFEVIVKQQIKRLEEPSLKCCQLVYDELIRILGQLLTKIVSVLFRYIHLEAIFIDFFFIVNSKHSEGSQLCENGLMPLSSISSNRLCHPQRSLSPTWSRKPNTILVSVYRRCLSLLLCRMQACYVNTTHPDFLSGHKVGLFLPNSLVHRLNDLHLRPWQS